MARNTINEQNFGTLSYVFEKWNKFTSFTFGKNFCILKNGDDGFEGITGLLYISTLFSEIFIKLFGKFP